MGIPSYFSYIIKNHVRIVRQLAQLRQIQHLFMDCNSIIYDLFHAMKEVVDESVLIDQIIERIRHYVRYIGPTKTLYIAFDGVAPLAKMEQQRTRRHKTVATATHNNPNAWSTCNITPGTPFMQQLSDKVHAAFQSMPGIETVKVSTSSECGEGEHKLFHHIRTQSLTTTNQENAAVYGLDSDLIMLSLFHCDHFNKLYVFRETPEFLSIPNISKDDPCHFLDIGELASAILAEMGQMQKPQSGRSKNQMYDYVLMCFFLGNDFLPHFPALNLRTHGLSVLMQTYRKVFSKGKECLTANKQIQWNQVHRFIHQLAKQEHELWTQEYETRAKWGRRKWSTATDEDRDTILQNVPVIYRAEEMYISPDEEGWQGRYYRALLPHAPTPTHVCENYVEGLAWVFRYYTEGCVNWRWRYQYHYPPLLMDLNEHLSRSRTSDDSVVVTRSPRAPYSFRVQLAYVIPSQMHAQLLEPKVVECLHGLKRIIASQGIAPPPPKLTYVWAFCRYFWESHIVIDDISNETLEEWDTAFSTL